MEDTPWSNFPSFGPVGIPPGIEDRLRRLEELLGFRHFIRQEHRPDLSQGALLNEPDLRQWS